MLMSSYCQIWISFFHFVDIYWISINHSLMTQLAGGLAIIDTAPVMLSCLMSHVQRCNDNHCPRPQPQPGPRKTLDKSESGKREEKSVAAIAGAWYRGGWAHVHTSVQSGRNGFAGSIVRLIIMTYLSHKRHIKIFKNEWHCTSLLFI